jgi:branched-subunit amino acid ABC-type transport system permease component
MEILPQLLVNALITGSIYALASSGLALAYGILRILNFAHGPMMMVGAYTFFFASVQLGFGVLTSALLTIVLTIIFAAVVLRVFILPFTRYSFMLTLVTTLALSNILEAMISMGFGVNVKSFPLAGGISSIEIWGMYITPVQILIITSAIVLLSSLAFVIHSTSIGRKIRAISEHPHAAESLGIAQKAVSYKVFIIGTLLAAYAGVLVGYETNLQPTMGNAYTIKAFAAMILGGLGNVWGAVIGSYIIGLIENLSIGLDFGPYSIPAGYKDAFAFVIILLMLLFKPQGLFGKIKRTA